LNLFSHVHSIVIHALAAMTAEGGLPRDLDFTRVNVEPPPFAWEAVAESLFHIRGV
jgi:hypothetical protein